MAYSQEDIQSVRLFEGLENTLRIKLFEISKRLEFPPDHVVLKEGDLSIDLYAILRGSVKITKGIKGELEHLATLLKGDCFGEMALLEGKSRSATVITLEPTTLLKFSKGELDRLFEKEPRLASGVYFNLASFLSARLRSFQNKVQEISWREDEIS